MSKILAFALFSAGAALISVLRPAPAWATGFTAYVYETTDSHPNESYTRDTGICSDPFNFSSKPSDWLSGKFFGLPTAARQGEVTILALFLTTQTKRLKVFPSARLAQQHRVGTALL